MFLFFLFLLFAVCLNGKDPEAVRQKCERPGLLRGGWRKNRLVRPGVSP
ncbi:hypothetical protein HMPREF9137_0784 [Prevotella denticola F0289]|nr:hypothetical protein HMPREF9137_0784 [Prevotella denticola F0289]